MEIESILNSCPLIPVTNNLKDIGSLTPNHFLVDRASPNQIFIATTEKNTNLHAKWKAIQPMTDIFWKNGLRNTFQVQLKDKTGRHIYEI